MWPCPRTDNHCHLGGLIPPETIYELSDRNIPLDDITMLVTMSVEEIGLGFDYFLHKFEILDNMIWTDQKIEYMVQSVCESIKRSKTSFVNVSLSLNKYLDHMSISYVAALMGEAFKFHAGQNGIVINLLLSLRYDSDKPLQKQISDIIIGDESLSSLYAGIDLVGKESCLDIGFYKPIFDVWSDNHKILRAHVGELPGTHQNVIDAIKHLSINRIAHGIHADNDGLKMAADNSVIFDLALHSNLYTGAIRDMKLHPIRNMIDHGCTVTLSTDDPVQFQCTLDDEYAMAINHGLMNIDIAKTIMMNSYECFNYGA